MGRLSKSFSFANDQEYEQLEGLARSLGYRRGGVPNVSALIRAIANQLVQVTKPPEVPESMQLVDRLIQQCHPFEAIYQKANGDVDRYPLAFARVVYRDESEVSSGHWYLEGYCLTPNPKAELPELAHNRCLRLDRLQSVVPITQTWRSEGMATIDLELHLFNRLAHNYTPIEGRDLSDRDHWIDGGTRSVTWQIDSYHWAKRLIFRYGNGCKVIAPDSFVAAFGAEVREMAALYESL